MSAQESLSIILNQPGFPRARPLSSDSKAGITEERATELINYQRNLEELRNTLSQVDSLLAEPPTPEIAAKCASLLGYVAAIDLPQEVKNQEAGRYPPQVQEQVHRALETQGTSTTRSAEAAAYGTAIMQRVAEEAQVRIQLEAKAAYEESRKVYEQQMQAYEMAFRDLDERVMKMPYTAQNVERYVNAGKEICHNMKKASEQQNQNAVRSAQNMSPKDRDELIRNQKNKEEEERRKAQEERERAQRLREEAKRYPPNSDEYKWLMERADMCEYRAGKYDEMADQTRQSCIQIMAIQIMAQQEADGYAVEKFGQEKEQRNGGENLSHKASRIPPKGKLVINNSQMNPTFAKRFESINMDDNTENDISANSVKRERLAESSKSSPRSAGWKKVMFADVDSNNVDTSSGNGFGNEQIEGALASTGIRDGEIEASDRSHEAVMQRNIMFADAKNDSDISLETDVDKGEKEAALASSPIIPKMSFESEIGEKIGSVSLQQGLADRISQSSKGQIQDEQLFIQTIRNGHSMG